MLVQELLSARMEKPTFSRGPHWHHPLPGPNPNPPTQMDYDKAHQGTHNLFMHENYESLKICR